MKRVIGIIPARYESVRFPGKPLVRILGKTLIQRTYENASKCTLFEKLIVATDDKRIYDHVREFGGNAAMTSSACATGSDRLAQVVREDPSLADAEIILNIQGDEPTVDPKTIEKVALLLAEDSKASVSTALIPIKTEEDALNPSIVKCVTDLQGYALYFSRNLIPGGKALKFQPSATYYKHLGIYGYRREFLLNYANLAPTPLQLAEDLEQLRVLEHGFKIKTVVVDSECMDVNTPEDLKKIEQFLCTQNSSL